MADSLSDRFSSLNLSSSSQNFNAFTPFKVIILENSPHSISELYTLSMNPKDMTGLSLSAGSFINFRQTKCVIPVWPNLAVPAKCIRISTLAAKTLSISQDETLFISPLSQSVCKCNKVTYSVSNINMQQDDINLIPSLLSQLPIVAVESCYFFEIGLQRELTEVKILKICTGDGKNISPGKSTEETCFTLATSSNGPVLATPIPLGGLEKEMKKISDAIKLSLNFQDALLKFNVSPPRGILLYGPPGTGKTRLAQAIASQMKLNFISVDSSEMLTRFYGESEAELRRIFLEAGEKGPSLIFIDEIDAVCPRRDATSSGSDIRIVSTLLTLMDGLRQSAGMIFVIAATNSPNSIDNALRRPGRFDCEIEIGIPNVEQRFEIFLALKQTIPFNTLTDTTLREVSEKAHGFVGADIALVYKEASLLALKRQDEFMITDDDLSAGFARVRPSAIREVLLEVPKVYWNEIGGQEITKQKLKESVEWPLKHPERFLRFGIKPPKGILLYGPPGCSKTLIAKALATESGLNFMAVKGPELFSKWVGDSEKAVQEIFRKARISAPSIIFFDEFDAIGAKRTQDGAASVSDRVLSQILAEMDGFDPLTNVSVVAATNRPDIIDPALMRPGRFDRHIYVPLPDSDARKQIFEIQSRKMPFGQNVDLEELTKMTVKYSGAEIVALCQEAAMQALNDSLETSTIEWIHFERSFSFVLPSTTDSMIKFFEAFTT